MSNHTYLSKRNLPLLYVGPPGKVPIVTLENYTKWYDIYLVMPDGSVQTVDSHLILEVVDEETSKDHPCLWGDHLYHPVLIEKLAKKLGAQYDERAQEVAAGRWYYESDIPLGPILPED